MSDKEVEVKELKKEETAAVTPSVYDPSKQYTWDRNAKFVLTGEQFGLWLNSTRAKVTSKEAREFKMAFDANEVIESIMERSVREGLVVEISPATNEK